jgi:hypothetical protein
MMKGEMKALTSLTERFESRGYSGTAGGWMERAGDAARILADYLIQSEPRAVATISILQQAADLLELYSEEGDQDA